MKVSLKDIEKARSVISDVVLKTRLEESVTTSKEVGSKVFFKYENEQRTGSFKIRGALNKLRSMSEADRKRGIVASSAGNHAQGVALAAAEVGANCKIIMPDNAPLIKQIATKSHGAEVVLHGQIYDEAYEHAQVIAKEENRIFIPPFEDELIMAGQGTIGLEIAETLHDLSSIIVPIGGGGLISGIAIALKELNPKVKVYGVVAENAPGMERLFHGKTSPRGVNFRSIADGISVKSPSQNMYDTFISKYVDDIVSVSEDDIAESILFLLEREKTVVEGSAAITHAGARLGNFKLGEQTCCVLSGGNIDMNLISSIINRGLMKSGRVAQVSVIVDDQPGALEALAHIIAEQGANVMDVHHDRLAPELHIRETIIRFVLETKNEAHLESVRDALQRSGIAQRIIQDPSSK